MELFSTIHFSNFFPPPNVLDPMPPLPPSLLPQGSVIKRFTNGIPEAGSAVEAAITPDNQYLISGRGEGGAGAGGKVRCGEGPEGW